MAHVSLIVIKDTKDPMKSTVRILGTANGTREAEKRVRQILDCSTQTLNKSTQTSGLEDSSRIIALEKRILHLERTLHAKESMIDEFLTDPVQFI